MVASVRIVDQHFGPSPPVNPPAYEIRLASELVTPREIIQRRIEAEIEKIVEAKGTRSRSILIPVEENSSEGRLNGIVPSRRKAKQYDVEYEVRRALNAFEKRAFIMLFDDRQIDEVDREVSVTDNSEITFVHLIPLKGG